MSKQPNFIKSKTTFVLKSNGQSLEFPSYRSAMLYRKKFLKLFPDLEIAVYKINVFQLKLDNNG